MLDPLSNLIKETEQRLTSAAKRIGVNPIILEKPQRWQMRYDSATGTLTSPKVFQLAARHSLDPVALADQLTAELGEMLPKYETITTSNGYLNFQIAKPYSLQLLEALYRWLQPQSQTTPLRLEIPAAAALSLAQNLRLETWLAAYRNLSILMGRTLQLETRPRGPNLQLRCSEHNCQTAIGEIVDDIEHFSLPTRQLIMLRVGLGEPITLRALDHRLHYSNPLYLTDYLTGLFKQHPKLSNPPSLHSEIIFRLLEYPLLLRATWQSLSFAPLLRQFFTFEQLTFKYLLWQNCNEKYYVHPDIELLQHHFLTLINYN